MNVMNIRTFPVIAIITGLTVLMMPGHALAYTDSGTISMVIQLIVGGLAGGLMALKLYWERIVDFFKKRQGPESGEG